MNFPRNPYGKEKQDLVRQLKALRDGQADPDALAQRIVDLRERIKYAAIVHACSAIGRPGWIATIARKDLREVAALCPAPAREVELAGQSQAPDRDPAYLVAAVRVPEDAVGASVGPPRRLPAGLREFDPISVDEVLQAHWALVKYFEKSRDPVDPPGVKDENMLRSAVSRQLTSIQGVPKYQTLPHLAAALVYGLAFNHPFHNGNKRTAFLSLLLLLGKNDYVLTADESEAVRLMLAVVNHEFRPNTGSSAADLMDEETRLISKWVSAHCRRIDRRLKPIDWRDLRKRLRDLGVSDRVQKGNFILLSRGDRRVSLAFPGDRREVGKPTVRQIWRELDLDVYDASAFYGVGAPVDKFILQYLEAFKALAHL